MPRPVEAGGVNDAEGDAAARTLHRPTPAEAAAAVEAALDAGEAVSVVGACVVGAAADDAESGSPAAAARRQVLLKPDGSVVVHALAGESAAASFSLGEDPRVAVEGDRLRLGDDERVSIERPELVVRFELDDAGGETTDVESGAHASLRDRLLDDPDLVEPGFNALATERETAAGPVDLFGRDAEGRAVVVEVKARRAGPAAVGQLDRYVAALARDLHADAEVRGVLVAPSATERTRALLEERGYGFSAVAPER